MIAKNITLRGIKMSKYKTVKAENGKYYFQGDDGKLYGEGYDLVLFRVQPSRAIVIKGNRFFKVDMDNNFKAVAAGNVPKGFVERFKRAINNPAGKKLDPETIHKVVEQCEKNKKDYTEIINRLAEQGFWGDWANKYTQGHDNEDDDGKAE